MEMAEEVKDSKCNAKDDVWKDIKSSSIMPNRLKRLK